MPKELKLLAVFCNAHMAVWPSDVYIDSIIISNHASQIIILNENVGTCHCENYYTNLSSNVVLAAEFTITSTSS